MTLDDIRAAHVEVRVREDGTPSRGDYCAGCRDFWPCDTSVVLVFLDEGTVALKEALAALQAAKPIIHALAVEEAEAALPTDYPGRIDEEDVVEIILGNIDQTYADDARKPRDE